MKAGDRCPQCKNDLLVRTEVGLACGTCSFELPLEELIALEKRDKLRGFRASTIKIRIDDPEEGENFLRGLIVARSNNSSPYFEELIEGVNLVLQPARQAALASEMEARDAA